MSRRDDRDRDRDRDRYRDRDRDYDSRRHRSKFDREPSPKRSRRDGKPSTERVPNNTGLDGRGHTDREDKQRRRLQDALPLEVVSAPVSKVDAVDVSKDPEKKPESKSDGGSDVTKRSSAPTEVPRSRSYLQHDERGNAGQVSRNFGRRATTDRSWNDSKDTRDERSSKKPTHDTHQKEEKPKANDDDNVWRHDGFFEMESNPTLPPPPPLPPPPSRKRPAFSEKKTPSESDKTTMEPSRPRFPPRPTQEGERRSHNHRNPRRPEKPFPEQRRETRRNDGFSARERHGGVNGGGNNNGRDGLGGQEHRASSARLEHHRPASSGGSFGEKWKHDLYDEANKSPPPKNEEDQIAKVEALLAS